MAATDSPLMDIHYAYRSHSKMIEAMDDAYPGVIGTGKTHIEAAANLKEEIRRYRELSHPEDC